jgi:hypothetical protein
MMAPVGFGIRFKRLKTLRASSKGQALLTWAWASSSELISIFGVRAFLRPLRSASGMLASACGSDVRGLDLVGLARGVFGRGVFLGVGMAGGGSVLMTNYVPTNFTDF